MQLEIAVGLVALLVGASATYLEVEGYNADIPVEQLRGIENDRAAFAPYEDQIRKSLNDLMPIDEFYIDNFIIHEDDSCGPTLSYHGYLESSYAREKVVDLVNDSKNQLFYFARKLSSIPQPPSTMVTAGVTSCQNGGLLLPNATCLCPAFYYGSQCQTVNCNHYGVVDGARCACPPGIYGITCESKGCRPVVQDTVDDSKKTFMLVVNQNSRQNYVINQVLGKLSLWIINLGIPFQGYQVTYYVKTSASSPVITTKYTDNLNDFVNIVSSIALITVPNDYNDQPHMRAIMNAQLSNPYARGLSPIFVFGCSSDSDGRTPEYTFSSSTVEAQAIYSTVTWRNRVLFVYSQDSANQADLFGQYYNSLRRFATGTLGDLLFIDSSEIDTILDYFLPLYSYNEISQAQYFINDFTAPTVVDRTNNEHVLITIEPNGTLPSVKNQDGGMMIPDISGEFFMLFDGSALTKAGVKTVNIQGSTQFSVKKLAGTSLITSLVTFTADNTVDVGHHAVSAEIKNYMTFRTLGVSSPPLVSIYDINTGEAIVHVASVARDSCSFNYIADLGDYRCTPGPLGVQIIVQDNNNVKYVRIIPAFCGKLDHHYAPTFQCNNGGSRNKDGQSCNCTSNWSGVHCEVPVCLNGGSPNPFPGNGASYCLCPFGYQGNFCEILACSKASPETFDYNQRSLVTVVQSTMSLVGYGPKITSGFTTMLTSINYNHKSDMFTDFSVYTMSTLTNAQQSFNSSKYTSYLDFEKAVGNIQYTASVDTEQDILGALLIAAQNTTNSRSAFYVFTDSPASNYDLLINQVIGVAISKQFQINVVITPPFGNEKLCMPPSDRANYATLARKTGGNIMNLCNQYTPISSGDPIINFISSIGSVSQSVETIREIYSSKCDFKIPFNPQSTSDAYIYVNSDITDRFVVKYELISDPGHFFELRPMASIPFVGFYNQKFTQDPMGYNIYITNDKDSSARECVAKLTEISKMSLTLGFAPSPMIDSIGNSLIFAASAHPVVHVTSAYQSQPALQVVITDENEKALYTSNGVLRSNCTYEYFFEPLACFPNFNDFTVSVTLKVNNITIQRATRAFCYLDDSSCLNGGNLPVGAKTCSCPAGYSGRYCEIPSCQNNGFMSALYTCICPQSYTGNLCQYASCPQPNFLEGADYRDANFQQITFVLNTNADQLLPYLLLKNYITNIVNAAEALSGLPKQYSLVTFTDTQVVNVMSTSHTQLFINTFLNLSSSFQAPQAAMTEMDVALTNAYSLTIQPPAIFFVFTGSGSSQPTGQDLIKFISQHNGAQVNIFYTPKNATTAVPTTIPFNVPTRTTGGRLMVLSPFDVDSLPPVLVSALSENALVLDDGEKDCSFGYNFFFDVEHEAQAIIITLTGVGITQESIKFTDGNGTLIAKNQYQILFSNANTLIISVDKTNGAITGGSWAIKIKNPGVCTIQVRARSPIHVMSGFSNTINLDYVKLYPYMIYGKNMEAYMAFHVTSSSSTNNNVVLSKLEIYATDYSSHQDTIANTDDISPRDSACSYKFISSHIIKFTSDTIQKVVVYGTDNLGYAFQRTFVYSMRKSNNNHFKCVNGNRDASTGFCTCGDGYTGETCEQRICQNGGIPSSGICVCSDGYYGTFCEAYIPFSSGPSSSSIGTTSAAVTNAISTDTPAVQSTATNQMTSEASTNAPPTPLDVTTTPATGTASTGTANTATSSDVPTLATDTTVVAITASTVDSTDGSTTAGTVPITDNTASSSIFTTASPNPTATFGSSTAPPPTPPANCDPQTTAYFVSFFNDLSQNSLNLLNGPIAMMSSLADIVGLGNNPTINTQFQSGGVANDYSGGDIVSDEQSFQTDIYALMQTVNDQENFNFKTAVDTYINNKYPVPVKGNANYPAFAVITITYGYNMNTDDFVAGVHRLQNEAGFIVLAVDASQGNPSVTTALQKAIPAANILQLEEASATATALASRMCAYKPI